MNAVVVAGSRAITKGVAKDRPLSVYTQSSSSIAMPKLTQKFSWKTWFAKAQKKCGILATARNNTTLRA
jgi:hypothetical protein